MSIYQLKPRFQDALRPTVSRLARIGVTANQVTVAAGIVSIILGTMVASMAHERLLFLLLPAWFALRMGFNAIDGMLAREHGQKTELGAYLNELTDVISDAALYLPFAYVSGSSAWLVGAIIFLSSVSEMAGAVSVMAGASRRYDGPMGKSDRAFVFGLLGLIVGCGFSTAAWIDWAWVAMIALLFATIVNRVVKGVSEARNARRPEAEP